MKIVTYIAAIECQSGTDLYAASSEEALNAKLAAYCRSHWETTAWRVAERASPIPDTDAEIIERFFDDHENDSLTTGCDSVDVDMHCVVEIFESRPTVSIHFSGDAARSCALDIAMENFWDHETDEDEARAAFDRELDEEGQVCSDSHAVHLLPILP